MRGTVGRRRRSTEAPFCEAAVPCRRSWVTKPLLLQLRSFPKVSAAASGNDRRFLLLGLALWSLPFSRARAAADQLQPDFSGRVEEANYPRRWRPAPLFAASAVSFRRASSRPAPGPLLSGSECAPAGTFLRFLSPNERGAISVPRVLLGNPGSLQPPSPRSCT